MMGALLFAVVHAHVVINRRGLRLVFRLLFVAGQAFEIGIVDVACDVFAVEAGGIQAFDVGVVFADDGFQRG